MAILQGSEVAYVERALVRAPAAFLGFEAHKEGHHLRQAYAWLFVLLHILQLPHGAIRKLFQGPETKNRVRMQLFFDCGLSGDEKTQIVA